MRIQFILFRHIQNDDTLGKIIYKASVTMSQTKYERVYALSQHLMHVCEEIHLHIRAKRKAKRGLA